MIYVTDLRASKICMTGARRWWADRGWSWSHFVHNGISEEDLLATGDHIAERVVREARARRVS